MQHGKAKKMENRNLPSGSVATNTPSSGMDAGRPGSVVHRLVSGLYAKVMLRTVPAGGLTSLVIFLETEPSKRSYRNLKMGRQ